MRTLTALALSVLLSLGGCRGDDNDQTDPGGSDGGRVDPTKTPDGGSVTPNGLVDTTIFKITSGEVGEGTQVVLRDVVVTAVDGHGQYTGDMYVQDPLGGQGSGLKIFMPQRIDGGDLADLRPGDHIKVEGPIKYFSPKDGFNDTKFPNKTHIKEIEGAKISHLGAGDPPTPAVVTVDDILGAETAEGWENVLVKVENVSVTKPVGQYGDFRVTGNLAVDDELYPHSPAVGECVSVTGISIYFYGFRLNPRGAEDIATGSGCAQAPTLTIADIQDESSADHPAEDEAVKVTGVVTAVDGRSDDHPGDKFEGFWIQDGTGPYSGIYVYYSWDASTQNKPALGDLVEVTATYKEFYDVSELSGVSFSSQGQQTVPQPEVVDAADIATDGSKAEQYEGVLVTVEDVEVGDYVHKSNDPEKDMVGFTLAGSGLMVEAPLYDFVSSPPAKGTRYQSITGVLHYSFSNFKILPRSAADMVE